MAKKRKTPKKPAPFRFTPEQRKAAEEKIKEMGDAEREMVRNDVTNQVAEMSSVAVAIAAHDIFGLNGWDLADFVRKYLLQFECICAGTVTLEDLHGILALEADLELKAEAILDYDKPVLIGSNKHQCICWQAERGSIKYWADKYGLKPQTLRGRLKAGWDVEKALTTAAKMVKEDK